MKITYFLFLIMFITSCKTTKNTKKEMSINNKYQVIKISGLDSLTTKPTLNFDFKKNKANGFAGCNRFTANFTKEKNQIKFGMLIATKMYCTNMEVEKAYLSNLNKIIAYKTTNNQLFLMDDSDRVLLTLNSVKE